MNLKDEDPEVTITWRPTAGEPSSAWRRLWGKLLANRRQEPANNHEAAGEGKRGNGGKLLPS